MCSLSESHTMGFLQNELCRMDYPFKSSQSMQLNKTLRGYAKYLIIQDPVTGQQYSVGMRHVTCTEGGRTVLANLKKNIFRTHKRHIHQWLCMSVITGVFCPMQESCPCIHITPEGYQKRRLWIDAAFRTGRRHCDTMAEDRLESARVGPCEESRFYAPQKDQPDIYCEPCQLPHSEFCTPVTVSTPHMLQKLSPTYMCDDGIAGDISPCGSCKIHSPYTTPSPNREAQGNSAAVVDKCLELEHQRLEMTKQRLRENVDCILRTGLLAVGVLPYRGVPCGPHPWAL